MPASDGKRFCFGSDEVLPSINMVKFPGKLAVKGMIFTSHVVKSNIPLMCSRPVMAWTVLDLPGDRAMILGKWVYLNLTAVGH